jgi:sugar O-acyltransferase (sialic acid O-acetyltransferase NeuD family)
MIIAGAGGHALEVIDLLKSLGEHKLMVYGEQIRSEFIQSSFPNFSNLDQLPSYLQRDPRFCLGLGNPIFREKLCQTFTQLGGSVFPLRGAHSRISTEADLSTADVMDHCYIGSQVLLGPGCLINTGAQIHHEAKIGKFSVVNPGAVLLGAAQLGEFCFIGAHATVLPGVTLGNHVTVGAGAVIIRDIPDGVTVVGVPGRILDQTSIR